MYLFRDGGLSWLSEEKIEFEFGATADGFGGAIYTDGEQVVIGAPARDFAAPG